MSIRIQFPSEILSSIKKLEKEIGLTPGFFHKLIQEDDWSFIIKLHSLFEASITHLLIEALHRNELKEIISNLEMSNNQNGKVAFARSLKLIDKDEARYIKKLSELRNILVHNIERVNLSLEKYANELDKQQFKSFVQSFGFSALEEIELHGKKIKRDQFIRENPKLTIWLGAMECLDCICLAKTNEELQSQFNNELIKFAKLIRTKKSNR